MPISFDPDVTHDFEAASAREWIEANGLGGFASGTVSGAHTRRTDRHVEGWKVF